MRLFLLSLGLISSTLAFSQSVTIKKVELAGEKVIIHYDLEDSNPNNEYLLNLYTSKDNFASAVTKVTGDVGLEIKPGTDKKMIWLIRDEYGGYKGKLALEIRGKVYVPFVRLQGFDASKKFKKGKSYPLTWKPGNSNPINIELYKGGERISGDINQPNNGKYTLFIPKHASKGSDYRIKFSDVRNSEEVVYTTEFKVGPKVPIWLVLAPLVAGGAAAATLTGGGNNGGDGKLPEAPTPK